MRIKAVIFDLDSLEIVLELACRTYTEEEKKILAERKNNHYRELIQRLGPDNILPGAMTILAGLKEKGIKIAIGSSSKNSPVILERIGLAGYFDAIVDGNYIKKASKIRRFSCWLRCVWGFLRRNVWWSRMQTPALPPPWRET